MALAFEQANAVLALKGSLVDELIAEVERLRAACARHETREQALGAELKECKERVQQMQRDAQYQANALQQVQTEARVNARRNSQEAKRREEALAARLQTAEDARKQEAARSKVALEQKDASLRAAQAQARGLQRRLENIELQKRNGAFVSASTHMPQQPGAPPWPAAAGWSPGKPSGGATTLVPPDVLALPGTTIPDAEAHTVSAPGHKVAQSGDSPDASGHAMAQKGTHAARAGSTQGQVSLEQQQHEFMERLNAQAMTAPR